jgi:uncharacterized small protein (DUF1192 family)
MLPLGICQTDSQQPLNEKEKRQVLLQLYELDTLRQQVKMYKDFFDRLEKQNDNTLNACQQAIQTEKEIGEIKVQGLQEQIKLLQEQVETYKAMYEKVTKKGGRFKCFIKKFFTAGIARC